MAAGRAAERGRSVLLLEKNPILGKKLLTTGGGRCNVTNNKPDIRTLAAEYKGSGQFLMSAFSQFDVAKTLDFFNSRGMPTKEELNGRIFPASDRSESVLDVLIKYLAQGGVEVRTNTMIRDLAFSKSKKLVTVTLQNGTELQAKSCVVATGGTSHPETGSTGDGFIWLARLGHTIIKNDFALVPLAVKDRWVKKISGVTLDDIKITVLQDGKKQETQRGRLLFTHFGVSGPMILNMSKSIGELLHGGEVTIMIDLLPQLDLGALKQNLQTILVAESNRKLKNSLGTLVPGALIPVLLNLTGINGETPSHSVSHSDRLKLVQGLKAIPLHIEGLLGANKAIVSSGGVDLREVNFKTMQSRLAPPIYLTGDVLNINRPSGGYSLQICWTTGFIAGSNG